MHPRVDELIRLLRLEPHPEGGHFVQTYRSALNVQPHDQRGTRAALTNIYFLLVEGDVSRWHRVASDEAWNWYEGAPLELFVVPPRGAEVTRIVLGPLSGESSPQHVVPAGWWQAARPRGSYSLVGCCVGPGFEFADFTLLGDVPEHERPVFDPASLLSDFL